MSYYTYLTIFMESYNDVPSKQYFLVFMKTSTNLICTSFHDKFVLVFMINLYVLVFMKPSSFHGINTKTLVI